MLTVTLDISDKFAAAIKGLTAAVTGASSPDVINLLTSIREEIRTMANDLSAELAALGTAIDKELQQVADAIAAGSGAAQALESARAKITEFTSKLGADDTPSA